MPTIETLTPALLSAIAGAILSLLFRFVPGCRAWYDAFSPEHKQLLMLILVLAVAVIIAIFTYLQQGLTAESLLALCLTIYTALTANQVTYQFTKRHEPLQNHYPQS